MTEDRNPPTQSPSSEPETSSSGVSRRSFLRWGALAGAGASLAPFVGGSEARAGAWPKVGPAPELEDTSIADLQLAMAERQISSAELVDQYLARIEALDRNGPLLNSVIEINPEARRIAMARDRERKNGQVRGPLHGIPFLIKDNIDSGDTMQTTAGSLALVGSPASQDARALWKLRRAGAVLLGKTGLSEWANFRGFESSSGWSGRGGQVRNPYVLDRNPCGSSSGSGAATSASLCAFALGTETDGSVVCPATTNGIVGIKPTLGLITRTGVVPISHNQDTIGVHGRTVADAAAVLGAMTGGDPADPATFASAGNFFKDYTQFLDPNGLQGMRIGVARDAIFGSSDEANAIFEQALEAIAAAGATVVDPAPIPNADEFANDPSETIVLIFDFKRDLNAYLANRTGVPIATLADAIQFNLDHADEELQFFGQEFFLLAEADIFSDAAYQQALATGPRLAGPDGIDAALAMNDVDALVAVTGSPAWTTDLVTGDHFLTSSSPYPAVAGYPNITVPAGNAFGLPVGINFFAGAWSEPTLIKIASGFEAATQARIRPQFIDSLPLPTVTDKSAQRGGRTVNMEIARVLKEQAVEKLSRRFPRLRYL